MSPVSNPGSNPSSNPSSNPDGNAAVRDAIVPACATIGAVVTDPPAVDLAASTPCADFDLRALIEHFVGTSAAMARLGLGADLDADDPWGAGHGVADGDWSAQLQRNLDDIGRGWSRAEAWAGEVSVGGPPVPRTMLGAMALIEVAMHGWDLAQALGRPVQLDPAVADAVHEAVSGTAQLGRTMGAYGPEVAVPDGASSLDRALGQAGRDPAWGG